MADQLPPPPVPADADLTDFKFMPLEVARLRRSKAWLICKRRPELAFFMLNLWTVSWHERPAGSLEDDDDVLADAAMCSPERWAKVRSEVLRGWVKCADGRLYHPVVAEKVMDSWHGKAVARWAKECDRIRKENHKRKENHQPALDFPPKPVRNSAALPAEGDGIPSENPLKGEGREGRGKGERNDRPAAAPSLTPAAAAAPDGLAIPEFLKRDRAVVDEAYALWTPLAYELRISDVGHLNRDRREALAARLAEIGGIEGWKLFLDKVREAEFLRNDDGSPKFWVGLPKLLEPEHFSKILEGRYAERHATGATAKPSGLDTARHLAELAADGAG